MRLKRWNQIFENVYNKQISLVNSETDGFYNFSGELTIDFEVKLNSDGSGNAKSEFWEFDFKIEDDQFKISKNKQLPSMIVLRKVMGEVEKILESN